MAIEICGRKADLPFDLTVEQASKFLQDQFPDLWRRVYTRHIEVPGNYVGSKMPAVTICTSIVELERSKGGYSAAANIALAADIMQRYNYPTYFISKALLESLQQTHPPAGSTWETLAFPFDGITFMLPIDVIKDPASGESINFLGVAHYRGGGGSNTFTPFLRIAPGQDPRIIIYYGTHAGMILQSLAFTPKQTLEPSVGWIVEATTYWDQKLKPDKVDIDGRPPAEFLSYLAGLVANFLLLMTARPEMVEPAHSGPRHFLAKQEVYSEKARFIGRKYEVKRQTPGSAPTGAHFTELIWRAGHFRIQKIGPKRSQEKTIWIDPYICLGRGLIREEIQTK